MKSLEKQFGPDALKMFFLLDNYEINYFADEKFTRVRH